MFTIIIPIYNKETTLEKSMEGIVGYLKKNFREQWRIILADRGSTDESHSISRKLAKLDKRIVLMQSKKRLGLGLVFKRSLERVDGDVITFELDALNDFSKIKDIILELRDKITGPDIISGSRFANGSRYDAPLSRRVLSKLYNMMINLLFKTKLSDYQCEFKAYKPNVFKHLCFAAESNHRFWLTESLVRSAKMDYVIEEIPVHYEKKWMIHPKNFIIIMKNVIKLKKDMRR